MLDEDDQPEFQNVSYRDFEADSSLSNEEVLAMLHLKELRVSSISEIRDRLKAKEREANRWDKGERFG